MIAAGQVAVNGKIVRTLGTTVDPEIDRIEVGGLPVPDREPPVYILLNKPKGILSTVSDDRGRLPAAGFGGNEGTPYDSADPQDPSEQHLGRASCCRRRWAQDLEDQIGRRSDRRTTGARDSVPRRRVGSS